MNWGLVFHNPWNIRFQSFPRRSCYNRVDSLHHSIGWFVVNRRKYSETDLFYQKTRTWKKYISIYLWIYNLKSMKYFVSFSRKKELSSSVVYRRPKVSYLRLRLRLLKVYAAEGRRSSWRLKLFKFSKFKCKFWDKNFIMINVHVCSVFKKVWKFVLHYFY